MPSSDWNSLEIAKLAAQSATPIVLIVAGIYVHRITKRFEHSQWRNQKLIERRLAAYDAIAPTMNDILCFYTYVGNWKKFTPPQIVEMKRLLDKNIYLNSTFFSKFLFDECLNFQTLCFETYNRWPQDARLKTKFGRRRDAYAQRWESEWEESFSPIASDPKDIQRSYNEIMRLFAKEIGVNESTHIPSQAYVPTNIR